MATGTATINFGAFPGSNEASVVVADGGIAAGSKIEAFVMYDSTADHTASDHSYFNLLCKLTCGTIIAATSFTIYATSFEKLQGTFQVRWVYV